MRSSWWQRRTSGANRLFPPAVDLIISIVGLMLAFLLGLIALLGQNFRPAIFYGIAALICLLGVLRVVRMHRK